MPQVNTIRLKDNNGISIQLPSTHKRNKTQHMAENNELPQSCSLTSLNNDYNKFELGLDQTALPTFMSKELNRTTKSNAAYRHRLVT